MNASLRFAFTSKVEKGAFYNTKEFRKNQKEFVYQKVSNQRKGVCLLSKGCYQRKVSNQRKGVHEKRKRGERKTKRKPKHVCKRRGCDNKTNTKRIKTNPIPKQSITK